MAKPKITTTYGPIHFEDLDPHRFEDLVRELIYDFKEWQSIEATGRSGGDEGFDIRAYEKVENILETENEDNETIVEIHPMDGNLWMIQGKREKKVTPKEIKKILSDIDDKKPPYGYILAVSANFSKKSYDLFRDELRKKGVMEFYLWGKAELEDMLHMPKNDRILFTFFGISLVSKRRSRTTEIRSAVSIKNKIFRVVGDGHQFNQSVLIRDLKDTRYPYEGEYGDFETKPRWKEYTAFSHHPLGLWCHVSEYFAYIDIEKKEWDFTEEANLLFCQIEDDDERKQRAKKRELAESVWDFLPRTHQARFAVDCLVKYQDIETVDEKGDIMYDFPHLYVDFVTEKGPFAGCRNVIKIDNKEIDIAKGYKRVDVFPKQFVKKKIIKVSKNKKISLNEGSLKAFNEYKLDTLYESDGKYDFLKPRDIISVENPEKPSEEVFIQITYKLKTTTKHYIDQSSIPWKTKESIVMQLGREPNDDEEINIYEFKRFYK